MQHHPNLYFYQYFFKINYLDVLKSNFRSDQHIDRQHIGTSQPFGTFAFSTVSAGKSQSDGVFSDGSTQRRSTGAEGERGGEEGG